ncbi:MAG: hypothetical protein EOO13_06760 [Chitinophagaceae bacterium]|nr:MAG: hypothetical protein EOO13_06760 [Chitinophagaceae bacterium]
MFDVTAFFYLDMAKQNKRLKWRFEKMANAMLPYYHQLDFRLVDDFDDEAFAYVMPKVKGINMLDLNETEIGNVSIERISKIEYVKELRIKGCKAVNNEAIPFINDVPQLEYLHAKGTGITIDGLLQMKPNEHFRELLFSDDAGEDIAEKMARLKTILPNCRFIIDGKPYT